MPVETTTEIEGIESVRDENGDAVPAANADEQQKTNDRLGNFPNLKTASYTTSGTTAEQVDSHAVPDGVTVSVLYDTGNAGTVWVGDSNSQPVPLSSKTDTFETQVTDTNAIYVRTPNAGDSVNLIWEAN